MIRKYWVNRWYFLLIPCALKHLYTPHLKKKNANNFVSYLQTKFLRAVVSSVNISQDALSAVYRFVLMQDYSHPWTDADLYKNYALSQDEIDYIETNFSTLSLDE